MTEVDDAGNNMAPAIPRDGSVPINIRGGYLKAFPDFFIDGAVGVALQEPCIESVAMFFTHSITSSTTILLKNAPITSRFLNQ